jgi:hypothetical protein
MPIAMWSNSKNKEWWLLICSSCQSLNPIVRDRTFERLLIGFANQASLTTLSVSSFNFEETVARR